MIIKDIFLSLIFIGLFQVTAQASDRDWIKRIKDQYHQGQYLPALQESDRYLENFPADAEVLSFRGWIFLKLEETQKADNAFDAALKVDPKWDNAYVGKGALAKRRGELIEAQSWYNKALEISPNDPHCLSSLASLEVSLGNYKKAVELGERAWNLNGEDPTISANLAIAYHYDGNFEKRDELYERAKELHYSALETLKEIFEGKKAIPIVTPQYASPEFQQYLKYLKEKLRPNWPKDKAWEGKSAAIRLSLSQEGVIKSVEIMVGSGDAKFDEFVLTSISNLKAMTPPSKSIYPYFKVVNVHIFYE